MRRWIGPLHGGQLIIAIFALWIVLAGGGISGLVALDGASSDESRAITEFRQREGIKTDAWTLELPPFQRVVEERIRARFETRRTLWGFALAGMALTAVFLPLAMLWVWFGARKRNTIVAEVLTD